MASVGELWAKYESELRRHIEIEARKIRMARGCSPNRRPGGPGETEHSLTSGFFLALDHWLKQRLDKDDPTLASLKTIVTHIANGKCRTIGRERERRSPDIDLATFPANDPPPGKNSDTADEIDSIKSRLTKDEYELLRLHYVEGKTYAEIGIMVGKTADAVGEQVRRLVREIRTWFPDGGADWLSE